MHKQAYFLLFISFYLSFAITPQQIYECAETYCEKEISNCYDDLSCIYAMTCPTQCDSEDECRYCSEKLLTNQYHWEYQLCSLTCIKRLAIQDGDSLKKLTSCENNICRSYWDECGDDIQCNKALICLAGCDIEAKDYSCKAQCLKEYTNSSDLLINAHMCSADCLSGLVSNSFYSYDHQII